MRRRMWSATNLVAWYNVAKVLGNLERKCPVPDDSKSVTVTRTVTVTVTGTVTSNSHGPGLSCPIQAIEQQCRLK